MPQQLGIQYQYPYVDKDPGFSEAIGEGLRLGLQNRLSQADYRMKLKELSDRASQFEIEQSSHLEQFKVLKGIAEEEREAARRQAASVEEYKKWQEKGDPDVPVGDAMRGYPSIAREIQATGGKSGFIRQSNIEKLLERTRNNAMNSRLTNLGLQLKQQQMAGFYDAKIQEKLAELMEAQSKLIPYPALPASLEGSGKKGWLHDTMTRVANDPNPMGAKIFGQIFGYGGETTYDQDRAAYEQTVKGITGKNAGVLRSLVKIRMDQGGRPTSPLHELNQLLDEQARLTGMTTPTGNAASRYVQENLAPLAPLMTPELIQQLRINNARYRGLTQEENVKSQLLQLKAGYDSMQSEKNLLMKEILKSDTSEDRRAELQAQYDALGE